MSIQNDSSGGVVSTDHNQRSVTEESPARASNEGLANTLMAEYYAKRSTAGLITAEATSISEQASGWFGTPGIYTDAMKDAWKLVTSAVHSKGGCIFLQLWHMGNTGCASRSSFHGGQPPFAPPAIQLRGYAQTATGKQPYELPRALETEEIPHIVHDFAKATIRARRAGFDGVEIHGANGCIIDQFMQSTTNRRTDRYGGTPENRARLLLEVVAAASAAWPGRVGVRLSPGAAVNGTACPDAPALLAHAEHRLAHQPLAYIHAIRPTAAESPPPSRPGPPPPGRPPPLHRERWLHRRQRRHRHRGRSGGPGGLRPGLRREPGPPAAHPVGPAPRS
jgi:N-ethylmaleimide reductase